MEIGFQKGMYVVFFKVLITIQLQKTQGIISGENWGTHEVLYVAGRKSEVVIGFASVFPYKSMCAYKA